MMVHHFILDREHFGTLQRLKNLPYLELQLSILRRYKKWASLRNLNIILKRFVAWLQLDLHFQLKVMISYIRRSKMICISRRFQEVQILCHALFWAYRPCRFIAVKYKFLGLAWMFKFGMMRESLLAKSEVSLFAHNHFHHVQSSFGRMRAVRNIILPTMSIFQMYGLMVILQKSLGMVAL